MFVYQGASDLDMFLQLLIPIKSLSAVTFPSLTTKWIRLCKQGKNKLLQIYWLIS